MVAQMGQPFGVFDHAVELVAMHDQEAPAVGHFVHDLVHHDDLAEIVFGILAGELVVVTGNEGHLGALAGLAQDLLHHVVMGLRPVP